MLTWKKGPETPNEFPSFSRICTRPVRRSTLSDSTTQFGPGGGQHTAVPELQSRNGIFAKPNDVAGNSVAPGFIGTPFNSTLAPVTAAAVARGASAGVAQNTIWVGANPAAKIPASRR